MQISFVQLLFQIVNFLILLFLLRRFLYQPILRILEQRAKKIHEGLEAAEQSIEERQKVEKERKKILVEAEKNAGAFLEGARLRAKKLEKELLEKTQKEVERKLKRSQETTKAQLRQMEEDLEARFAQMVVQTSQTLLSDTLSEADQRRIIVRQIKKLKSVKFVSPG